MESTCLGVEHQQRISQTTNTSSGSSSQYCHTARKNNLRTNKSIVSNCWVITSVNQPFAQPCGHRMPCVSYLGIGIFFPVSVLMSELKVNLSYLPTLRFDLKIFFLFRYLNQQNRFWFLTHIPRGKNTYSNLHVPLVGSLYQDYLFVRVETYYFSNKCVITAQFSFELLNCINPPEDCFCNKRNVYLSIYLSSLS